ncbi:hypothetical protein LCGC14_2028850 [marine sediment metagenome]|uniref:Uncharacterized protein n=1 Tax=marine sediment metagenome TaxID=412755 RepID=A0A0F9EV77_9ZZZZ
MSGVPVWLVTLGAIPLAWGGLWLILKGLRRSAHLIVTMEKAAKIILYELVPNEDDSIKDKVDRAVVLGEETQRALENHLVDHHHGCRSSPEGTPEGF